MWQLTVTRYMELEYPESLCIRAVKVINGQISLENSSRGSLPISYILITIIIIEKHVSLVLYQRFHVRMEMFL